MVKTYKMSQLDQIGESPRGCLIDTNVLFALNNLYEKHHKDAHKSFQFLSENNIPVYTNVTIRSEFIDLLRRVLIPKYLLGLGLKDNKDLEIKMKELRNKFHKSKSKRKTFIFQDNDIKEWRILLSRFPSNKTQKGQDSWETFCSEYLSKVLSAGLKETEKQWNMRLLSYKADKALFIKEPEWDDMISFVERFGIGSSDAMILNFFLCSKIQLLLTADRDLLYAIKKSNLFKNKIIAIPDSFI